MTKNELVKVMNVATGRVQMLRRSLAEHPVFGKGLAIVKPEVKPYTEGLYTPQTVEEFVASHPFKVETQAGDEQPLDEKDENGI